jgi:tetratricopeptide (TPR) repeat protein
MKKLVIFLVPLILVGFGVFYWLNFMGKGENEGIIKIFESWKLGDFREYKNSVINYGKFEEMLFLNSLLGRTKLRCSINLDTLYCEGFLPVPVKVFPSSIEILGDVYLAENPKDWKSMVKKGNYYGALQLCAGQFRGPSKADSLYLEKTCIEKDINFWRSVSDRKANAKFLEILLKRRGFGYVCLDKNTFLSAEIIFSRAVSSPKVELSKTADREVKILEARLKDVEKKLEVAVKSSPDPLAEAFYRRGLDYFSKGDYKNAEIFFNRALKVDPNHEKAREALERVRRALGK